MMRSLYSGVSGMQNHQTRMDVIGNNISNVNTTGFKRGRVNFQDLISQQMSGAAKPTDELGGVNPKEIGLGMNIASIDTIHTQGSLQTTGIQTDVAISGNGFFVMKAGEKSFYTRAGTFGLDNQGTLVNPGNGMRVQGWQAKDMGGRLVLNTSSQTEDLVIPVGSKIAARATTNVDYACNLDKRLPELPEGASAADVATATWATEFKVYDNFGEEHTLNVSFTRVPGTQNQWKATVNVDPTKADQTATRVGLKTTDGTANTFNVTFDNNGMLQAVNDTAGNTIPLQAGKVVRSRPRTTWLGRQSGCERRPDPAYLQHQPRRDRQRAQHGHPVRREELDEGLRAGRFRRWAISRTSRSTSRERDHRRLLERREPHARPDRDGELFQSGRSREGWREYLRAVEQLRRSRTSACRAWRGRAS